MAENSTRAVEILKHARHDWLNQIQLIQGNISLGRYERVEEIIRGIVQKARHESRLSTMNVPKVADFLLTFNWGNHWFILDVEVLGETNDYAGFEEDWYTLITSFTKHLDKTVSEKGDNHLLVTFHLTDAPYIEMDFQGELKNKASMEEWVERQWQQKTSWIPKEAVIKNEEVLVLMMNDK
ncbi:Spo0B C-terminal domain-containing protein [Bacillus sp. FJAT-44742]|uniref:Spo0B C-terminal domain-containing protein n=1 Tax=Bacillus sp. FJAT-44742 TaxID=2014005 RepID=UPI000C23C83C|nr:Spo0B C-terminal domain-containing protein [Bacillus sp. FJAT-44742]